MKKYYKVILSIPMIALALWGINYYGNNHSHTEEYFKCLAEASTPTFKGSIEKPPWENPPLAEYLHITKWFYGADISVRLQNLIAYFPSDECNKSGDTLRCFSKDDSGATNLTFNLNTNQGEVTIRRDYSKEVIKKYDLKCELQK